MMNKLTWGLVVICLFVMFCVPSAFAQSDSPISGRWVNGWGVTFDLSPVEYSPQGYNIGGVVNYAAFGWSDYIQAVAGYGWWSEGAYYFYLETVNGGSPEMFYLGAVYDSDSIYGPCPMCTVDAWWGLLPEYDLTQAIPTHMIRQPGNLSIAPSSVGRGQCFTASFALSANLPVDVVYGRYDNPLQYGSSEGYNGDYSVWRILDQNGQTVVCPDESTPGGPYHFYAARNALSGHWVEVNADVFVYPGQQPEGFTVTPTVVQQGECFQVEVFNGENMSLDLIFSVNGGEPFFVPNWTTLDQNGRGAVCTDPYWTGLITFVAARNSRNNDWDIWAPVGIDLSIGPRQPSGLIVNPSVLVQGDCFVLTVPNGAGLTLDVAYRLDYGEMRFISGWPSLDINGQAYICTDALTWIGVTTWAYIRNTFSFGDTGWVETNVDMFIHPPPPVVTGIEPQRADRGAQVSVTITGMNLTGAVLATNHPGLTIQDVSASATTVTATFVVSPTANTGSAAIALNTLGGTTTTQFVIAGPILNKEYIYLGGRVLAIEQR